MEEVSVFEEVQVIKLLTGELDFFESFNEEQLSKFYDALDNVKPGDKLEIYWSDIDYTFDDPHEAYVLAFPSTPDWEDGNLAVHAPCIPGEKGDYSEAFIHIVDLCNIPLIKKLKIVRNLGI